MLVWGWVLASILTICVSLALSEYPLLFQSRVASIFGLSCWAGRHGLMLVRRMDQLSWSDKIDPRQSYQLALNVGSGSCKSRSSSSKACASSHLRTFLVLQIALAAADTFSCVQLFLSFLYLVSMETSGTGYYPSNAGQLLDLAGHTVHQVGIWSALLWDFVEFCTSVL